MSRNWDRQIQVIFDTRSISLEDFDISFKYSFDTTEEPNEATIDIKNLSESTINTYIQQNRRLIVNAGYRGNVGNILKGYILDASSTWKNADKDTTITGFDASFDYLDSLVSKSYRPGIRASEIIVDLCRMTGLVIGEISLVQDIGFPRGRSVMGKLRESLRSIVMHDCLTNFQIINGIIMIRPIGFGLETGFVLSPDTGLIGSPEPVKDAKNEEDGDVQADYKIKCLLNHRIGCMSRIMIDSKYLKAQAVVLRGTHQGSKAGNFMTEMEVKLI